MYKRQITEGETDALTLRCVGLRNVVSLPQGAGGATQTDLSPLLGFSVWLLSTDADEKGEEAAAALRDRARRIGSDAVRLRWSRLVDDEMVQYKDANEMRQAGATDAEFRRCVDMALRQQLGFAPSLGGAMQNTEVAQ